VPSVGLGTTEVTLVALTSAYTTFPNRGTHTDASPLRAVIGATGKPYYTATYRATRVIPRETAALMTGMLEDVVIFGVSNPLRKVYGFRRPVGGKTGTTNDYHDAWFIGFTPDVVAGVWVGYDQPRTLEAPAAETALPVWARVTTALLKGVPETEFASDHDVRYVWIDPWSGKLIGPNCPSLMRVPFLSGTAPRDSCTLDHTADWAAKFARRTADSLAALGRGVAKRASAGDSVSAGVP
jgi:penicillin-binding protein 1A